MYRRLLTWLCLLTVLLVSGCAAAKPAAPAPAPATAASATPAAGWPRQVKDADGNLIEIKAKPMHIHTLSVGYDEISMRLVGPERFAAVGTVTVNPAYSNIAAESSKVPLQIGRKSEDVLAARPDLVVASPFANKDLVKQLKEAGLTVVVTNLSDSMDGQAANIRFLAQLYGEEAKGEALVKEVTDRLARLDATVAKHPAADRPKVLSLTETLNTPGKNTTLDGIIRHAGGLNAAAEAGLTGWQVISPEKVVEIRPEVILVTDPEAGKKPFVRVLLENPVLQNVPAVKNRRVYSLPAPLLTTLSQWNVRGAEELAKLLWPEDFKDVQFAGF